MYIYVNKGQSNSEYVIWSVIFQVFCFCVGDIQRYRFPLLALISFIFFLRRWRQSHLRDFHHPQGFQKPPQQRPFVEFRKFGRYVVMFWFCNILSCSVHMPMFSHTFFSRRPKRSNVYTYSGFCLDFCLCGCCSGEPFANGDLDAEWDAMARQCPA